MALSEQSLPIDGGRADHHRWIVGVIILASLLLRVGYFIELNGSPCAWQHRGDRTDMNFFDHWAREVAAGDWLTDQALHPQHDWHKLSAATYFRLYPEQAKIFTKGETPDESDPHSAQALWNHWYGGKRFHQEPLYPYLIALTYRIFGPDVRWVFAWQMLLGVCINVLIYLIARRLFGSLVATAAGLLAVLCGPALFYEMVLLRVTLISFMGLLLIYVGLITLKIDTRGSWLAMGLVSGLALLVKTTFVLVVVGLLALLAYQYRHKPNGLYRSVFALAGGILIALLPAVVRNLSVGTPPFSLSSVNAVAFAQLNMGAHRAGIGVGLAFKTEPLVRIMAKSGGRFLPTVIETLKTHPDAGSYLRQLRRKLDAMWHWYEVPNNTCFYYYRLHSRILQYLPVTFVILAPLALVGLVLSARHFQTVGLLYVVVISLIVPLFLAGVLSRYRIPLVMVLLPFAALTIVRLGRWLWRQDFIRSGSAITALVFLSFWTMRPLPARIPLIRPADYQAAYEVYYDPLVRLAQAIKNPAGAAEILEESLRYEPEVLRRLGPFQPGLTRQDIELAQFFARVHLRCAKALLEAGQTEAANFHRQRAVILLQAIQAEN